jgi:hypothetical protein
MIKTVEHCRICGNKDLKRVLDLGVQALTGIFPKTRDQKVATGPLELVQCTARDGRSICGLLQLRHSCDLSELYGDDYGYRSGLNGSMVSHLGEIVAGNLAKISLKKDDIVLDIGSNDGTLLSFYPAASCVRVGIDPTAKKFGKYYAPGIQRIPEFFSADLFKKHFGGRRAKIVTSIAMFYDLEDPVRFASEVFQILEDDGLWVFEQSYMPLMLERNAYDTVCHEHLEYYCASQVEWVLNMTGFRVLSVDINATNGGSFCVRAVKQNSSYPPSPLLWQKLLDEEKALTANGSIAFSDFEKNILRHRNELTAAIRKILAKGKKIFGYGASTKGNVILQYCGLTEKEIPFIAEVNEDKFGSFTPGTRIPIISEKEARALKPDYFLVLPWHFKENIMKREKDFLGQGHRLLFPLPIIEEV